MLTSQNENIQTLCAQVLAKLVQYCRFIGSTDSDIVQIHNGIRENALGSLVAMLESKVGKVQSAGAKTLGLLAEMVDVFRIGSL